MARLFEDLGGELVLNAPVEHIVTADRRVTGLRLAGGETRAFDQIASNADIMHTYARLLGGTRRGAAKARALARKSYSMSLFIVHFGLRGTRPDLRHHMVLFGRRYRELIGEIFRGPALAEDFSLYLHAPSVTDDSLAPPGHSAYYVLSPVPHLGNAAIDWDTEGPRYRDRILDYLERHYMPGLRRDLVTTRHFTPLDFRSELNAHLGSAFSIEPVLTQSAWFRPRNRDEYYRNLYLVGAGTHPGAGIPGVVGSAKATAGLMIGDARG